MLFKSCGFLLEGLLYTNDSEDLKIDHKSLFLVIPCLDSV